jgi:hypothetical protein
MSFRVCSSIEIDLNDPINSEAFFFYRMLNWGNNWPVNSTISSCQILKSKNGTILERYGQFMEEIADPYCPVPVLGERFQDDWPANAWLFQTCNEFGYYISSDPRQGVFGYSSFSGDGWGQDCAKLFGPE